MAHTSHHASSEARKLERRRLNLFLRESNRDGNTFVMLPDQTADSKTRKKAVKKATKKKLKKITEPLVGSSSGSGGQGASSSATAI